MFLFSADGSPGGGREATFLHAINRAAAMLQHSVNSEENVLRTFSAQMDRLKLIGLIGTFDEANENLIIRSIIHSTYILKSFERLSRIKVQDFSIQWQAVDALKQAIQTGQTLFLSNSAQLIEQIIPQRALSLLNELLDAFGGMPAILTPLKIETDVQGILIVAAPELLQSDLPVFEALANHIAIALTNARLFESLRQAEAQYHTLFEASTDAIFLETLEGQVLDCNATACAMFGYSKEEMLELTVADLVPDDLIDQLYDIILQESSPSGYFVQSFNKRKDGSLFPVEVSTRPVTIEGHQLIVAYIRDISDRQRTEGQLHETQAALRGRVEELASLYAVSLKITATYDLPALLETIVEQATRLLDGTQGGFYLCDPERNEVHCVVSYHTKRDYTGTVLKYGEGLAGKVAQTGEPLIIDDYRVWIGRAAIYEQEQPFQAVIAAPVIWQGQVSGVLHVLDDGTRHFTNEELELLTLFANQAAVAIENARLLESERRRRQEAETLHRATATLTSTLDLNSVLDNILTCLEEVIEYDSASVFLLRSGLLYCQAARGHPHPEIAIGQNFPADNLLIAEIWRSKRPLILNDVRTDPRFEYWGGTDYVRSWMGIPMIVQNKVIGYLTCDHRQPGVYRQKEATLAEVFANQAAIAIENARLFEAERSQLLLAQTLQKVGALLTSASSLDEVLESILDLLGQVVEYDSVSIQLLDPENNLFLAAGRGFEDIKLARQTVRQLSDHILKTQFAEIKLIVIPDTYTDERWVITPDSEYIRSWVGAPLLVKGRFIGSLSLDHRTVNAYNESISETVLAFANQAAIAIENARLFEAERSQLLLAKTLQKVGALLTSTSGLDQVLESILDLLGQVVVCDSVSIHLLDPDGQMFLAAGRGYEDLDRARQIVRDLSTHLIQHQWAEKKPIVIPDTYASDKWIIAQGSEYICSWVGAPLLVKDRFIGSLNVDSRTANMYDKTIADTVMAFANQAAVAIENARLFEAERVRIAELQAVREASLSLTASLELPQVLDSILQSTLKLLPEAQNGHIFLYNPDDGGRLTFGAALWADGPRDRPWSEPRRNGLTHTVARTGELIVVPDMQAHPLFEDAPPEWEGAIVGLPLKIGPRIVGVMNVSFRLPHQISESELRMLRLLGDQAAIAIENARLYEQAATERRHLGLLHDLSREITSSLEPDDILRRAAALTCQALGGVVSEAFLFMPDENHLSLRAIYGKHAGSLEAADALLDMRLGKGLTGWVAQNRQAVYVSDVTQDEHWIHVPGLDDGAKSTIIAPILAEEQLLGVLSVLHSQTNAFTPEHLELVITICQEVGLALSNAHRYQQVQRRLKEITLIQSLTQTFSQRLEVQALLDEVVTQLTDSLGFSQIAVFLIEADHLVMKAWRGRPPTEHSYPLSRGVIGRVARTGQAALVQDVSMDPDYYYHEGEPYVAELAVPIFRDETVVGVISILSEQIDELTDQDRDLLQVFASQISVTLENAELYEQIRQHAEELEHTVAQRTAELIELYNLSQEIGYPLSYEEMLRLLLRRLHKATNSDLVMGCLVIDDNCFMLAETSRPLTDEALAEIHSHWLEDHAREIEVALQFKAINYDLILAEDFDERQPDLKQLGSLIQAPIIIEGRTAGILIAGNEQDNAFSAEQERLLSTFASQASSATARLTTILSVQQKQLESLVEHLPIGVLLLDTDFRVLVSNPLGQEIASLLSAGESSGLEIIRQLGEYSMVDLIDRESSNLPVEITLEGFPRRIFAIQIRPAGAPVSEEKHHWVLTLNDITQERENMLRIQIQERLATVGQLAAGIAHDFNNIMAAILVYTDLLRYDPAIPAPSQEKLTIIQQQVERASSLIRQILDFSRRSVMEQSAFDLLPLVKELDKMLARILPETIQLELDYQPEAYWVKGDPTRLQQVFMNLALNARDAMPEGGVLRFELSKAQVLPSDVDPTPETPPGDWIQIVVTDTGSGIPPEVSEHIFEPFFTTKPAGQGTGLGLAQVYGIVKQHDGYINLHSQMGQGSSFTIHLPALQTMSETEKQQARSSPASSSGGGQMVMVVEDDRTTRQALQALLEAYDYQVATAPNGVQALQAMEERGLPFDLLISDIVMPEMGGLELSDTARDLYPGLKILFITGHPLKEESQAILEEGKTHWLQKPFSVPEFIKVVKELLEGN